MAVTYDAPSNTITVLSGEYDFQDLYDADVAGGWGVVSKQGDSQFLINCDLTVGDGTEANAATLQGEGRQVEIGCSSNHIGFLCTEHSIFQIGSESRAGLASQTPSMGWRGNSLVIWQSRTRGYFDSFGTVNLYSCYLENPVSISFHNRFRGDIDFKDVTIGGEGTFFFLNTTGSMHRVNICVAMSYGFMCYTNGLDLEDVYVDNVVQGLVCGYGGAQVVARNCYIRVFYSPYADRQIVGNPYGNTTFSIYDCDWDIYAYRSALFTGIGRDQEWLKDYKSIQLRITDVNGDAIEGATASFLSNQGETIEATTDADGKIAKTDLLATYITHKLDVDGTGSGTTYNDYTFHTPYTMTISKSGYLSYVGKLDLLAHENIKGLIMEIRLQRPQMLGQGRIS